MVSIIPSLIAKEAVVGFFGQVLQEEGDEEPEEETELSVSSEINEIITEFFTTVKDSVLGLVTWDFFAQFETPDEEELEEEGGAGIIQRLRDLWTDEHSQEKAYSFMIFMLLTIPCVAATGALRQELSAKNFLFAMALYILLPFLCSFLYYQIAILL